MATSIGLGILGQASWFGRVAIGLVSLRRGLWSGRDVLFSGLGQDGFAVVENGLGKVAEPHGRRSYRPGQMDCRRLRCEHIRSGAGGLVAMVCRLRECNACVGDRLPRAVDSLVRFAILTKWFSFDPS